MAPATHLSGYLKKEGKKQSLLVRTQKRFFRVEGGRSPQEAGTGLGLSIARNMIERAGGELTLESEVGKGSLFRITLNRDDDDDDDDD